MLDVILEHFISNDNLGATDSKTVREALLRIVKYYCLKDVNIKEVRTNIHQYYFLTALFNLYSYFTAHSIVIIYSQRKE